MILEGRGGKCRRNQMSGDCDPSQLSAPKSKIREGLHTLTPFSRGQRTGDIIAASCLLPSAFPGEWRQIKLGWLISVKHGWKFKSEFFMEEGSGKPIVINIGNFKYNGGFRFNETNVKEYSGEYPAEYEMLPGDILLILTCQTEGGEILGIPGIIPNDGKVYLHNQRLGKIIVKNDSFVDLKFLYWLFLTSNLNQQLVGSASGTKIVHTAPSRIENCVIALPPLPEQKAIAAVLSSLDEKIDLLHRQNKTLEAMAETLFHHLFIEEAQEDWTEGTLGDEFDFTMGQSPSSSSFNEEGIGVPMFQGNADFGFRFPKERVYTTKPKKFAKQFDTLISVRASVGAQNMAYKECCIGRGVAAFKYKKNIHFYTYTYFKLRSFMKEIKKFNDEGTVFGSISKLDFEVLSVTIPPNELIEKYEQEASPVNNKVIANCEQIQTLEKLRDALLPKLMSGEVRVAFDGGINMEAA
ncbi:MAG: restriction endonuclease subunit S [Rhizonema sp. PD37]|nr:restriction endonuclease subunit S [Rhizonema sp. PD37]